MRTFATDSLKFALLFLGPDYLVFLHSQTSTGWL